MSDNTGKIKMVVLVLGAILGSAVGTGTAVFVANKMASDSGSSTAETSAVDSTTDSNNDSGADTNSGTDTSGSEQTTEQELLTPLEFENDGDRDSALTRLNEQWDKFISKPRYLEVQVGEDLYETHVLNTKGERIVQSSDGTYLGLFTNDNRSVRVSNEDENTTSLSYNSSVDAIWISKNAIKNMNNGTEGYTFKYVDHTENNSKNGYDTEEFVIDVYGRDACIELYNTDSPDEEYRIGEKLIDTVVNYVNQSLDADWTPHIEVGFMYSDKEAEMITYLNVIFDGRTESNWLVLGSMETPDWSLDDYWYTVEFSEDKADELADHLVESVNSAYDIVNVDETLGRYGADGEYPDGTPVESGAETTETADGASSADSKTDDNTGNADNADGTTEVTSSEGE